MKKNKIVLLYIDSLCKGGAQRVMTVLANNFIDNDYKVILVNDFEIDNKSEEYYLNSKVERIFLKNDNNGNFLCKNFSRIIKLRKIVKSRKPQIVLSFLGRPNLRMLIATCFLNTEKIVSVRNDPNFEYGKSFFKKFFSNIIFLLADKCVFQTEDAKKYFLKRIQKKSKIIFNPVDEKFYNLKESSERNNIITVGRIENQKNHKLLIDSFKKIVDDGVEEKLFIYGEGSLKEQLQKYTMENKLDKKVFFMGNSNEIENVLKSAKLFVLSSDFEGMPNSLMEAMASGVACVSTDCPCGGPKSLFKNENNGILVPCNDSNALALAMKDALNNYKEFGENAKKRANDFSTKKILEEWNQYLFD